MTAPATSRPAPGRRPLAVALLVGAIVVCGVALDQATKAWAERALDGGRSIAILPTLELDLHYNSGFSFGTGQGAGRLIAVVVIAMSAYLVNLIRKERSLRRAVILSTILAGALGNLVDRIARAEDGFLSGDVVDFIDVSWFAIFNVADIFVVCGVIVFAAAELLDQRRDTATDPAARRSGAGEGVEEPLGERPITVDGQRVEGHPPEHEAQ